MEARGEGECIIEGWAIMRNENADRRVLSNDKADRRLFKKGALDRRHLDRRLFDRRLFSNHVRDGDIAEDRRASAPDRRTEARRVHSRRSGVDRRLRD